MSKVRRRSAKPSVGSKRAKTGCAAPALAAPCGSAALDLLAAAAVGGGSAAVPRKRAASAKRGRRGGAAAAAAAAAAAPDVSGDADLAAALSVAQRAEENEELKDVVDGMGVSDAGSDSTVVPGDMAALADDSASGDDSDEHDGYEEKGDDTDDSDELDDSDKENAESAPNAAVPAVERRQSGWWMTSKPPKQTEKDAFTARQQVHAALNGAVTSTDVECGGCDYTNRLTALRSPYRKSTRWVVTVIIHFLKLATVNAWIVYRAVNGQLPYVAFFRLLALRLLALRKFSKPRGLWAATPVPVAAKAPQPRARAGTPPRTRGRCAVCGGGRWDNTQRAKSKDSRSKTSAFCASCSTPNTRVWLCSQGELGVEHPCWRAHMLSAHKPKSS
jgi:hypothetical protein